MSEPTWISKAVLLAIHGRLLAEHGGASGLRDEGLLESALASPRNHFEYGETDIFVLAASYAFAITSSRPFIDGNKRSACASTGAFLELNGFRLTASEPDAVRAVLALSKGEIDAQGFAAWLRLSCVSADDSER